MITESQRGISHDDVLDLFLAMLEMVVFGLGFGVIFAASQACVDGLIGFWHWGALVLLSEICVITMAIVRRREAAA